MRRIAIEKLLSSREEMFGLRELLGHGGVVAIPTETYYGLAVAPDNATGLRRVCQVKGRDDGKPLSVVFGLRSQLDTLGIEAEPAKIDHYFQIWPAPLTVIFAIREPLEASRGLKTLGVRVPATRKLRSLLATLGPVTATSANRSGRPALDDPNSVEEIFRREIDILIDDGRTPGGKPSTVIDATQDPPALVRAGAFAWPV